MSTLNEELNNAFEELNQAKSYFDSLPANASQDEFNSVIYSIQSAQLYVNSLLKKIKNN